MLTRKTYTPASQPKAVPILPPTFTPEVRWQALIEAVKLRARRQILEHGCYTEKAERAGLRPVSTTGEIERKLLEARSARSLRLAENVSEFIAISPTSLNSATTKGG